MSSKCRQASHAGSWYSGNGSELSRQLGSWLDNASGSMYPARAIIAPHAGYSYCGACGAYAYRQIDPKRVKRVFILGPSHHVQLNGCALTKTERYQTPLYDLIIDTAMCDELRQTGKFEYMDIRTDEDEHSIEMQLPYIAKVMESKKGAFTVVPVLVGGINPDKEALYGSIFAKYLADPENLFVISSDFCHWGERFRYTYYDQSHGEIWKSIENLDKTGMDIIQTLNPAAFTDYLKKFQNTICGRHPIGVLLNAISHYRKNGNGHRFTLKFVQYAQSSQVKHRRDSSVSYASAALTIE